MYVYMKISIWEIATNSENCSTSQLELYLGKTFRIFTKVSVFTLKALKIPKPCDAEFDGCSKRRLSRIRI